MQLFYEPNATLEEFTLSPEEARHCLKVLRKKVGDTVHVVDGYGKFYECVLQSGDVKKCRLLVQKITKEQNARGNRHIAIAPTKNQDRIEWFVEKAVEIGIDQISFLQCDNSERKLLKLDRVVKKAISAMKQSIKATLPQFSEMIPIEDFLKQETSESKFIAYVDNDNTSHFKDLLDPITDTLILIGPEGDFSKSEIQKVTSMGFEPVSLGSSRLRTETAGLVACTYLNS